MLCHPRVHIPQLCVPTTTQLLSAVSHLFSISPWASLSEVFWKLVILSRHLVVNSPFPCFACLFVLNKTNLVIHLVINLEAG